jgi:ribonuclease-3
MFSSEKAGLIERYLGYTFNEAHLLGLALTHASTKSTSKEKASNERLEFLGDAVLGLVISELLYEHFPGMQEGELTLIKSELVSRSYLVTKAQALELNKIVQVGEGLKDKDKIPDSVLANTFEAILGAIYLDGGMEMTKKIIYQLYLTDLKEDILQKTRQNYKALLQHYTQKELGVLPEYKIIKRVGPHHAPLFTIVVKIEGKEYGTGEGSTVKTAEQDAAQKTMETLHKSFES